MLVEYIETLSQDKMLSENEQKIVTKLIYDHMISKYSEKNIIDKTEEVGLSEKCSEYKKQNFPKQANVSMLDYMTEFDQIIDNLRRAISYYSRFRA